MDCSRMRLTRLILQVWVIVWVLFLVRPFSLHKSSLLEYLELAKGDFETRRRIAYGTDFCRFLNFCKARIPGDSRFQLVGFERESVDRVRAYYYLYPRLSSQKPDYILVYKAPWFRQKNTIPFAAFDSDSFILRNEENQRR
jgi:hypothetical protein